MKVKHVFLSVCILTAAGCADDSSAPSNQQALPTVEYGGDVNGDNELSKYTNADWLYQNYFGEYGLPDELRVLMLPELKMVANGFALQHSRGENVQESISQLNTAMQMLYYSGQLGMSMQQMVSEHGAGSFEPPSESAMDESENYIHEKEISPSAQENIKIAEQLDIEYALEQEQLVKDHNLPYELPGRINKYVTYTPAMKSDKGGAQPEKEHVGIDAWGWWNADIIWSNGAGGIGHMGIVDDNTLNGTPDIIDANTDGVKIHFNMDLWANNYSRVEGWWYTDWTPGNPLRNKAVNYAIGQIGSGYNWVFWNREATDSSYCSQLIWQAFRVQGVDLDPAGGIIWPNDILNHARISRFNSSSI